MTKETKAGERTVKGSQILFFVAIWPDLGGERDLIYCPDTWTRRKIINKFLRRNKGWDAKKAAPMLFLMIDKTYKPPSLTH